MCERLPNVSIGIRACNGNKLDKACARECAARLLVNNVCYNFYHKSANLSRPFYGTMRPPQSAHIYVPQRTVARK